jgi:hypothetical protein
MFSTNVYLQYIHRCIICRSVCPLVVKLYAIYEGVTSENLRKYSVLNGNFVFDLRDFDLVTFTGTRNRGIKLDLPVLYAPS